MRGELLHLPWLRDRAERIDRVVVAAHLAVGGAPADVVATLLPGQRIGGDVAERLDRPRGRLDGRGGAEVVGALVGGGEPVQVAGPLEVVGLGDPVGPAFPDGVEAVLVADVGVDDVDDVARPGQRPALGGLGEYGVWVVPGEFGAAQYPRPGGRCPRRGRCPPTGAR